MVILSPNAAANVSKPNMLLPSTELFPFMTFILDSKEFAALTKAEQGLACRPELFLIIIF